MSVKMKVVRTMVKTMSKGMFDSDQMDVQKVRGALASAYAEHKTERGVKVDLDTFAGVEVAVYTPEQMSSDHIVYYVHGGGLVTGDRMTAGPYSSQLALATGCRVVACSYRLAPEDPFPAGVDDSYNVYKYLLESNPKSKISLIGESGGAYLSLVLAIKARDEKIQLPSSLVLNSIPVDMSGEIQRVDSPDEITVSVAGMDQLAKLYAPGMDLKNPLISPIFADLTGLPPMKIIYDKGELLAIDSKELARKAKAAGVIVDVTEYKGCFHAFTTTGKDTPESNKELIASSKFMVDSFNQAN